MATYSKCRSCGVQNNTWVCRDISDTSHWLYFNYLGEYKDKDGRTIPFIHVDSGIRVAKVNRVYVRNGYCQHCQKEAVTG